MLVYAQLYLVNSTVEKGTRKVKSLLGANGPIPTQIQAIDKHNTLLPALCTQRNVNYFTSLHEVIPHTNNMHRNTHHVKKCFVSLTGSFTNVSLGYPYANSLPMKNPGKLGVSERVFHGA